MPDVLFPSVAFSEDQYKRHKDAARPEAEALEGPVLVSLADVKPEAVRWLWRNWIPFGKLTDLYGDPGLGKSCISLDIAARVTRGLAMPDGSPGGPPGNVVTLTAEDGLADTVRPRLDAAGGDPSRVKALVSVRRRNAETGKPEDAMMDLSRDVAAFEQAIVTTGATLAIFDPITAYLGAKVNSWRDSDVRSVLGLLARVGESTGAAILVLRHPNKASGSSALYRGGGSIAFIATVRSGIIAVPHPDDDDNGPSGRCILSCYKHNLGKKAPSLVYAVESYERNIDLPVIAWLGDSNVTADQALAAAGETYEEKSARGDARGFLKQFLRDGKEHLAAEVFAEAAELGIKERTLRRAKTELGVSSKRSGFGEKGGWTWKL